MDLNKKKQTSLMGRIIILIMFIWLGLIYRFNVIPIYISAEDGVLWYVEEINIYVWMSEKINLRIILFGVTLL